MNEPWKRNLSVPFFSQRENETVWKFRAPTEGYQYDSRTHEKGLKL